VQFVVTDPDEPDLWFVRLGATATAREPSAFYTYDARTGALLGEYPLGEGVMNVLLRLHVDLFAGLPGTLFLGFMGLLFIAAIVSGVVLYGPFMRKLPFGAVRRERAARIRWLDLHNLIGIATLVWALVVGATGVVNTLSIPIFGQWKATQLAEMIAHQGGAPPQGPVSTERAVAAAREAAPGREVSFMAFPGNDFASPHHFVAFMRGETPWRSRLLEPVLIEAASARVVAMRELPWYVTALLLSQPLHFGDYGGLPLKLLWAALDVLTIVVLGSGLYLWLARRRARRERAAAAEAEERARRAARVRQTA
jgi:uncharacterized iron-regulated membrane protein